MPSAAPLTFIPPQLDAKVLASARLLLPLWLRRAGITAVEVEGIERLQQCLEQFQTGQSRLLLAFRHPSVDDPAVLAQLLWNELARAGRPAPQPGPAGRPGRHPFRPRPHAPFHYDRGIPLWAGEPIGWLLCHLGGCSIQRSKLDLPALRTARALLLDGPYPFAVAPEGATNGHNELISPLEPGVAQLALWTADDLERAGRSESTQLLPIGLQYSFTGPVWPAIEALLRQLEADAGLPPSADAWLDPQRLYGRLLRLAELILSQMERFYRDAYHQPLPQAPTPSANPGANANPDTHPNDQIGERLARLLEAALRVVEQSLAVEPHGDVYARCRRLEQAGWDRLYPANGARRGSPANSDAGNAPPPSALERGLADRLAEETERRLWHMRIVESFAAVSGRYVKEDPSQERFADTLLILWDTLCRIKGGTPERRPRLGPRRATIRIGEPLAVAPQLPAYRADRRTAVAALTAELQQRLQGLIVASGQPQSCASRLR
jgi:1-acyl-sn-glycerol-3-phosphate acyltransferase